MILQARLQDTAQRVPDKEALRCKDEVISFGELERESNRLGHVLRKLGLKRSDRVAIVAANSIEFVVAHWGILKAGGISVPIPPESSRNSLTFILRNCTASYAIVQSGCLRAVLPALASVESLGAILLCGRQPHDQAVQSTPRVRFYDMTEACGSESGEPLELRNIDLDTALIIHTSGSTGHPKGVMLSHLNLDVAAENIIRFVGIGDSDVELSMLPLTHTFGLAHIHCYARMGGRVILESNLRDPLHLLKLLASERVTSFPGTPAMFGILLEAYAEPLARYGRELRYIVINTAPMPVERAQRLLALLPGTEVYMYYGLTEASRSSFLRYREDPRKMASVGRATPNVEIGILDETMQEVPPNTEGEVVIRGSTVMQGYWNAPDATRAALTTEGLRTGDLGYLDEDGFLYITGRIKDLINVDGQKVSPQEIEHVVLSVEGVRDAAAVPHPHPLMGEVVKVFVVKEPGSTVEDHQIIAVCRSRLETYKVPREISFCDTIPRTQAGKMQRFALRHMQPA
jgi:long-chain acyl-CoA synthetase